MQPCLAAVLPLVWGCIFAGPLTVPCTDSILTCLSRMLILFLMWPRLLTGWEILLCRNHSLVAILLIFLEHSIQGELWTKREEDSGICFSVAPVHFGVFAGPEYTWLTWTFLFRPSFNRFVVCIGT